MSHLVSSVLALMLCVASLHPATAAWPSGIVVEEVRPGMAGEEAGLERGDVLLSWRREGAPGQRNYQVSGELVSPFDLVEVFLEQVPRGRVVLEGRRGDVARSWVLSAGAPSDARAVRTAPALSGELLSFYQQGRLMISSARVEEGTALLSRVGVEARASGRPEIAVWFLSEAARVFGRTNRWSDADTLYGEALSASLPHEKKSIVTAQLLREWGDLYRARRIWDRAKQCFERALAADREKSFDALSEAWSLTGLGYIDNLSNGPERDGQLFAKAMEIRHRLAADSADDAASWLHWGNAAALDTERRTAIERYERAIRILEKMDTGRLLRAEALAALARVRFEQRDLDLAARTYERAYALARQIAPDDPLIARITQGLGLIAVQQGNLSKAEELLALSLEVSRRASPESLDEADALYELGRVERQDRKQTAAAEHLCRAMDLAEAWRKKFQTNEEIRTRWGRRFGSYYHDCAESLLAVGRAEESFQVMEKGRARAFLAWRAERSFRQAIPSSDRSLEWADLGAEYDRVQEELERVSSRKESRLEDIVNIEARLREIRRRKERILEERRPAGSIRYPEPLSLTEALQRLEPGTALLSYSVGKTKTLLFILFRVKEGAPAWKILPLEVNSTELRSRVGYFRDALFRDRANGSELAPQARRLYDLLVHPAEPYIANCDRIVISPDGPLHTLSFAALLRENRYLVEWKPIHFVLSASVYADLLTQRQPAQQRASSKLIAFGDVAYSQSDSVAQSLAPDSRQRKALQQGLVALPATRKEVEGIGNLFPGSAVFLGEDVTEGRVKTAVRGASLIHFAVHGLLDERNPLNSALVLSRSKELGIGRNNGLLQAWEIMESLPLDADLVTLSACDTALGQEIGGEGLIGLTRAFQYAGARSVLATLWGISDGSTSDFMVRLYSALREGETKDGALRSAQMAQIHSSKAEPFYWAAFQLYGDWR